MSYVSSNQNRFYAALESGYGQVPAVTAAQRFPAVKLATKQQLEVPDRKDKTGSRTFTGVPAGGRKVTTFDLRTYMTSWSNPAQAPVHGPLFQAGLGAAPLNFAGATAAAGSTATTLVFGAAHGLAAGQAVTFSGEVRFVTAVPNQTTVQLNAPFSIVPAAGAAIGATATYGPATELPSLSLFDYWSPSTAVQRILCGAAVNRFAVQVNADYHQFEFSGVAQDLLDSSSFSGQSGGGLSSFPAEPALAAFDYSIVPGNLGQAWLGIDPDRFYTITAAVFALDNALDMRSREFGSALPRSVAPGRRSVALEFELFQQDDSATAALYQAARQQSPVQVMFQLGEQSQQLFGVYLKSVVPDVPEFDDSETRLRWRFRQSRAQGTVDDEIMVAFG
jgi:hypothetical protein